MRDEVAALAPVHFIGIGGVGMSAIARILLARGVAVSGSDQRETPTLEALRALGADVFVGHEASNLSGAVTVVFNSAIRGNNPELAAARSAGLAILHRAQLLAALARGSRTVAVSGTHGKTTTSAMIATICMRAGIDPTFLVGSDVNEQGTNAHAGTGEWFIAEADESDGSLLWLAPEVAVVTNAESDHLDHYSSQEEILATFAAFLAQVKPTGLAVLCADDPGSARLAAEASEEVQVATYGMDSGMWRIDADGVIRRDGSELGRLRLNVPGDHNLRNALASIVVADHLGVSLGQSLEALASFRGTRRRFEERGSVGGIRVVDDYAHHPTELAATLQAARQVTDGRVIAIFQPHLFSRTQRFAAEIGKALADADAVGLLPIYGAREDPIPGVTSRLPLMAALEQAPRLAAASLPDHQSAVRWAIRVAKPGDLILTLGAGDVTGIGPEIVQALSERREHADA